VGRRNFDSRGNRRNPLCREAQPVAKNLGVRRLRKRRDLWGGVSKVKQDGTLASIETGLS